MTAALRPRSRQRGHGPSGRAATCGYRPVEGGTRLGLMVESRSDAQAARHVRVGWTWCLEGLAELLDAAA